MFVAELPEDLPKPLPKIDHSFINDILCDDAPAIVPTIIALAPNLDLTVVAEASRPFSPLPPDNCVRRLQEGVGRAAA